MRWYSGDALSDGFMTSLTPIEENCYRRLMDYNFRDGFIPDDPDRLARLCKLTPDEFIPIWEILSSKFPPLNSKKLKLSNSKPKLSNPRIKFELDRQKNRSLSAKMRGAKGGRPPKFKNLNKKSGKPKESYSLNSGKLTISDPDPDPNPDPDQKKEKGRVGALSKKRATHASVSAKKTSPSTSPAIQWDPAAGKDGKGTFIGERDLLRTKVRERYSDEFGAAWIQAEWSGIVEWCQDNPKKIAAKKNPYLFLLACFRSAAKRKREREG